MNPEELFSYLREELRQKYGKESDVFLQEGNLLMKDAAEPNAPIIPEEVGEIVNKAIEKFSLNPTDLSFTTNNGNIIIHFSQ